MCGLSILYDGLEGLHLGTFQEVGSIADSATVVLCHVLRSIVIVVQFKKSLGLILNVTVQMGMCTIFPTSIILIQ